MRAFLALLAFAVPMQGVAQPAPSSLRFNAARPIYAIPFELHDNRIQVQVSGPGFGPAWFIVDTGAQSTHFTAELVARAALPTAGAVGISGVGPGRVRGRYVRPTTLRIGALTLPVGQGIAAPGEALFGAVYQGSSRRFEGVIGYDLFDAYAVEIDYEARLLRLYARGSTGGDGPPLRLVDRKPYVETVLDISGRPVAASLHLDTGYSGAVGLNAAFVDREDLLRQVGPTMPAWTRGVGGVAEARLARLGAIRLGGFTLARPIASLAQAQGAGVRPGSDGRIGGDLLRHFVIRIDYAARRLRLSPAAAFAAPFEADMSGATLIVEGDAFLVWRVASGSPAAGAGLRAGDRLTAIDGQPTASLTLAAIRDLLKADGARRVLQLSRGGEPVIATFVLRRQI